MGQQQSKDELLYQQVNYGQIEPIKALCQEGAGLEWIDNEGKTPLILACLNSQLFNVAKTLIELGANVNAYRPGRHAGTPLHHAAKRGHDQTVKLLLSHGANALILNDDCLTALDLARQKGYTNVVRTIENHICLFCGWMRELYGPGFLEALASQWLSKKIWVVVIPCSSRNLASPLKLEMAVYTSPQEAQPRTVIALWKAKVEEPKFHLADPSIIIFDSATKTRYKIASANEGDKQQLRQFDNACRGISPVMQSPVQPPVPATAPLATADDVELAMAINASIHSSMEERPPLSSNSLESCGVLNTNDWGSLVEKSSHNGWGPVAGPAPLSESSSSSDPYNGWDASTASSSSHATEKIAPVTTSVTQEIPVAAPSAPPIPEGLDDGLVHYPSIDSSPVDLPMQTTTEGAPGRIGDMKEDGGTSSSCSICLDTPVEGACVPCGHMAGCMSCLNEIKAKKWGCPVCRAKIQQVIRVYAV